MCQTLEHPLLDLLVIGAGPAGLSVAIAAKHRGARRVLVVEQASALREVGQGINLQPNAMRALHGISPTTHENFKRYLPKPKVISNITATVTPSGDIIREVKRSPRSAQTASAMWWQVQRSLIDSMPGTGFLLLNHKLADLKHSDDYVTAHFVVGDTVKNPFKNWQDNNAKNNSAIEDLFLSQEDALEQYFDVIGEQDQKMMVSCRAKLVVGADGINSVARACIYRDSGVGWEKFAKPVYSGYVSLAAVGIPQFSDEFSKEDLHELYTKYFQHAPIGTIACSKQSPASVRLLIARMGRDESVPLYVGVTVETDESAIQTKSHSELAQMGFEKALEFGVEPALRKLFDAIAKNKAIVCLPFYVVPAAHERSCQPRYMNMDTMDYPEGFNRPWHHGRVVLVGDAVHAGPNFFAQGAGLAIEDALNLAMRLEAIGMWDDVSADVSEEELADVFEQYRLSRLERVSVHQESMLNLPSEYNVEERERMVALFTKFDPTDIEGKRVVVDDCQ